MCLLRPLIEDGRLPIVLPRDYEAAPDASDSGATGRGEGAATRHVVLGRSHRDNSNQFGLSDPRISRRHVRIEESSRRGTLIITAIGKNPIALLRRRAADAPSSAAVREVLQHGERSELHIGDRLQLVMDDFVPPSLVTSGGSRQNECVYLLQAGSAGAAAGALAAEAPVAAAASSARPPARRRATPVDEEEEDVAHGPGSVGAPLIIS